MRKNINVSTLNKVKEFLNNQTEPRYLADIVKELGVNFYSLKMALTMIKHKVNKSGQISVRKK